MTEELLGQYTKQISGLTLIPSGGGVFEVMVGDKLVFSKKELGRFPDEGEVAKLFAANI
ncbi:hypothetical protein [Effusibacillus lacus]|uniref:Selenoprotein n=1 Tax=Effusibacillus lacus TaxID=1348429 RepID=A0A292YM95_9BACL|nr:hypothetical protein [Effusibacillus lacus]